jgi:transcriptional regulator with XRE-family HTH domain
VLALVEAGEFFEVTTPEAERKAIKEVEAAYEARRRFVAALGAELGAMRRRRGLSQEQLARRLGTKKSNISRLESGRYGGLSLERLLAALCAVSGLSLGELSRTRRPGLLWWIRTIAGATVSQGQRTGLHRRLRPREEKVLASRAQRLEGVTAPVGSAESFRPPANLVPQEQQAA